MEALSVVDLPGSILVIGLVFWLAGGSKWLSEKTRELKLENDRKEKELNQHQ